MPRFHAMGNMRDADTMPQPALPPQQVTLIESCLRQHQHTEGPLLPVLHDVQDALGYIPPGAVTLIAQALQLSRAEVHGVMSFYPHFRTEPGARHHVEICQAESCQAMGALTLGKHAASRLGCELKGATSDGAISLAPVYCLGLCAQSPALMIDGQPYARVTPERFDELVANLEAMQ